MSVLKLVGVTSTALYRSELIEAAVMAGDNEIHISYKGESSDRTIDFESKEAQLCAFDLIEMSLK